MKQFSLEEYKKNPKCKVVTRSGKPVSILFTNFRGDGDSIHPILAVINQGDYDEIALYLSNGRYFESNTSDFDLFFDSHERSLWTFVYNIAADYGGEETLVSSLYKTKEAAEEAMKRLNGFGLTEIAWDE